MRQPPTQRPGGEQPGSSRQPSGAAAPAGAAAAAGASDASSLAASKQGSQSGSGAKATPPESTPPGARAPQGAAAPQVAGSLADSDRTTAIPVSQRSKNQPVTSEGSAPPADASSATQAISTQSGDPEEEHPDAGAAATVAALSDEVYVIDEHPRYHVTGCRVLAGTETIPLSAKEAVEYGFTPCGICSPVRVLAGRNRAASSS